MLWRQRSLFRGHVVFSEAIGAVCRSLGYLLLFDLLRYDTRMTYVKTCMHACILHTYLPTYICMYTYIRRYRQMYVQAKLCVHLPDKETTWLHAVDGTAPRIPDFSITASAREYKACAGKLCSTQSPSAQANSDTNPMSHDVPLSSPNCPGTSIPAYVLTLGSLNSFTPASRHPARKQQSRMPSPASGHQEQISMGV